MAPVVVAEHLTKRYGRRLGVEDVSFEAGAGEVLGLLGPNGSGKTTILRILTGYLQASSGRASVAGFDIVEQGLEARRRIGYVPEDVPLYASMRVDEFLAFMGRLKGLDARPLRQAVDATCTRLALEAVRGLAIGKLSRGYRQRVMIAQALLNDPEVLILDEPTNGLDPRQIIEVRELIRSLSARHTILVTSHILSEIERVATRVAILLNGRLLTVQSLEQGASPRLRVRVRAASPDAVRAALGAVPGVAGIVSETRVAEGVQDFVVQVGGALGGGGGRRAPRRGRLRAARDDRDPHRPRGPVPRAHRRGCRMRTFATLLAKETRALFVSPIAYAVMAVFLLLMGYTFTAMLFLSKIATLVHAFFQASMLLLLIVPVITMRLLAEERRSGTLELLLTAPVREIEVVLAKFLASMAVIVTMLAPTVAYPITLQIFGDPDWGPVYSGYLGLVLLGGALTSLGLAVSALTANQIVAATVSLGLFLLMWMLDSLGSLLPDPYDAIVINLSLLAHFTPFATGALYLSDLGFFATLILLGLLLSVRALARR